jgi:hypothetical protein
VVIVLRDVEEEFVVTKSAIKIIVGSNPMEFKLSYTANSLWIATYMVMVLLPSSVIKMSVFLFSISACVLGEG